MAPNQLTSPSEKKMMKTFYPTNSANQPSVSVDKTELSLFGTLSLGEASGEREVTETTRHTYSRGYGEERAEEAKGVVT